MDMMKAGCHEVAYKRFVEAIEVTPQIAHEFIIELRKMDI